MYYRAVYAMLRASEKSFIFRINYTSGARSRRVINSMLLCIIDEVFMRRFFTLTFFNRFWKKTSK